MSITNSYGFRSAQAAYENANPYDSDCTCEGEGYICKECATVSDQKTCPEDDCMEGFMRELEPDEIAEHFPNARCPQHGSCPGCYSRYCEDCGGEGANDD